MRRLPDPPFRAALLLPRWLGDAVMASALIAPLRRLSGNPVEVWAPEHLAPIFSPGGSISEFKVYEGRGRHRGLGGARLFGAEIASRAEAVWVIPDSLSSALAAFFSGVVVRVGRAGQGRSPLLSHPLRGLRRDRRRHWIDEKADLLRPFHGDGELEALAPRIDLDGDDEGFLEWLSGEGLSQGGYDLLAPGAAFGPAKRWRGFRDYAAGLDSRTAPVLVGSLGEKQELEALAEELEAPVRIYAGDLDLARLARLCRSARRVLSNDSGVLHLAAAAGAEVTGIFLSTEPAWTAPRAENCRVIASAADCRPCFRRRCPLETMVCQEDVSEKILGTGREPRS